MIEAIEQAKVKQKDVRRKLLNLGARSITIAELRSHATTSWSRHPFDFGSWRVVQPKCSRSVLAADIFVSAGETIGAHYHDFDQWIVLKRGRAVLFVGGEAKMMQKGESMFVTAHQVHNVKAISNARLHAEWGDYALTA